jgi:hypothetical protein
MNDTSRHKYRICTLRKDEAITFAAHELAKYLLMMDDIQVEVRPAEQLASPAQGALYLGLVDDFGMEAHVDIPRFDDRVHARVTPGLQGIIAGTNARSVLLAVYRFLEAAGCRWVRPGPHGEVVPRCEVRALSIQFDETPSYRYRGMCIEGAVSYENMAESIDWLPKVGLNSYFSEFIVPYTFFDRWYRHLNNKYKEPEELTLEQVVAFRQRLEQELGKRGLLYHSVGHGWTCEPFGIPGLGWDPKRYDVDDEVRSYLAEVNGKRDIWRGIPLNTQLCLSNAEARKAVVDYAVRHVQQNESTDVLHVWLADSSNNHCECADCRDTLPADFYVRLLNEMDAAFTQAGIDTKIAFIAYLDLLWPPQHERFNNPDRFVLLFAPISRTYSKSYDLDTSQVNLAPYKRNKLSFPSDIAENLAYLERWQEIFRGDAFTYEYYFMWDHYFDPAYYETAKIIHQDVKKLKLVGLNGIVSDQTQRAYFPTGFGMYVLAKTLWDDQVAFDDLADAYFEAAFGPDGGLCRAYMAQLSQLFDPPYLRGDVIDGEEVSDKGDSHTWILDGGHAALSRQASRKLAQIPGVVDAFQPIIERNLAATDRCWAKSWEYLTYHSEVARLLALAFKARAEGDRDSARAFWERASDYVQRSEDALQPVLDVFEFVHTLGHQFR